MEDEHRPLPKGWVRSFDPETSHQFYVNTTTEPPTSIWTHPYDDPGYLSTLSSEERERIEQESLRHPPGSQPTKADIISDHTDNEHSDNELPPRPKKDGQGSGEKPSFGRKMKDKITGTTHEERERERARRAEEERRLYQQHLQIRQAMSRAMQTGEPQLIGKDKQGKDVYIEPPPRGGYGMAGGPAGRMYPGNGYGYSPYSNGMYATPNARYIRPGMPYGRPYGGGFGGGMGLPLMMGGGLMGGLLLGDALGGF